MYIAILGRQPEISLAEIRAQFENVRRISGKIAEFDTSVEPKIDRFGGILKFGKKLSTSPIEFLNSLPEGKITLGVSDYSRRASSRSANYEALKLKKLLKKEGRSVRILPNSSAEISSAAACHEKLGRKPLKVELLITERNGVRSWYVSVGSQDIEAYTRRDQARPARDAKNGMLPPKLAQILINLCGPLPEGSTILDPFCGTGVVLQEARLMGYQGYGTDLSERIVGFAKRNMEWLESESKFCLEVGDATNYEWKKPVDAVVSELYLGPPMSKIPVEIKLKTVKQECSAVLNTFLKNLATQIEPGTPVVLAIPAWKRENGAFERLSLDEKVELEYNGVNKLGFSGLLYARPDQIVAREIIVLRKK